jgi:peptidoglycan DL-endopeptidase CwlO
VAIPPMPPRTAMSSRRSAQLLRRTLTLVAATAVAIAGVLSFGVPAQAKTSAAELKKQISTLNNQIEQNGEKYNGAQVTLGDDQKEQAKLAAAIGPLQLQASVAHQQIGTIAASVYMNGSAHETLQALLNGSSTQTMLDELGVLNEMARGQKVAVDGASAQVAAYSAEQKKQDALVLKDKALVASLAATKKTFESQLTHLQKLQSAEDVSTGGGGGGGGSSGGGSGGSGSSKFSHSYVTDGGKACPQTSGSGKGHTAAVKACSLLWPVHMYRLTAAGPTYYDCSGLTMVAWRAAGVSLDHFTGDQIKSSETTKVSSESDLEVGDLVFYNSGHHVTLYIGNGYIVQAEETGQPVKISPITFEKIYAMRRPIQ